MTALPLSNPIGTKLANRSPSSDFEARLLEMGVCYADLWHATSDSEPNLGEYRSRYSQWVTYHRADRLVGLVADQIEQFPSEGDDRCQWRRRLEGEIRRFGSERLAWPVGYGSLLLGDEFFDATVDFVRAARQFDPRLDAADVGQALRNVWIVNSLQMLLELPVVVRPATFAYSLLYPYTDNYLDDPGIPRASKQALVERLGGRLTGQRIDAVDQHQHRIFRLIETIEDEFDRVRFPDVYWGLLAIHRAQVESMEQQGGGQLEDDEILRISFAKGGTSVLADGYLAAGTLAPEVADFCFGYGVFLQLLDDLQDARADCAAGHQTMFSRLCAKVPLDSTVSRLHRFMKSVVHDAICFNRPELADRKDLILRNCSFLLVGAIAENPEFFSRGFVRRLQRRWPFRFRAVRRLGRQSKRRISEAGRRLCDRRGVESVLDLI